MIASYSTPNIARYLTPRERELKAQIAAGTLPPAAQRSTKDWEVLDTLVALGVIDREATA